MTAIESEPAIIYGAVANRYRDAGWPGVLPLPARQKKTPPDGFTGESGGWPDDTQIEAWTHERPHGNVALRAPDGVIGIDVDQYGDKRGADNLDELGLWPLPPTWVSTSRPSPSGIHWYRVPRGVRLKGAPVSGVEIVQHHHRYAVAPPSVHPDTGANYRWISPSEEPSDDPPSPDQLPELTDQWIDAFRDDRARPERREPVPPTPPPRVSVERSAAVQRAMEGIRGPWTPGGRHDHASSVSMWLARLEHSGHPGATEALDELGAAFLAAKPEAETKEWLDLLSSARETAQTTPAERPDYQDAVEEGRARRALEMGSLSAIHGHDGTPRDDHEPDHGADDDEGSEEVAGPTSWEPIDLRAAVAGERPPPPAVLVHKRGHRLLYAGRTHTFQGPSESLKSWCAQLAVAETLAEGGDVLYIDFEDDETGVVERLRALGATDAQIIDRLVYLRPDEPLVDKHDRYTTAGLRFYELLGEREWVLAILDGVTEAMTTEGLELNDNADAAHFARRIMRPMANTGAATVAIDHQTKSGEDNRRFALGAQHKLAGLTGASFSFKSLRPLSRAFGSDPVIGTANVTVAKDRPGHVRARSAEGKVGVLRITAWPDGGVDAELVDPADLGDEGADMALVGRILDHLSTYEGESANQLEKAIPGKGVGIRAACRWLKEKGWVEIRKEGQANKHYLTDKGRREGLQ